MKKIAAIVLSVGVLLGSAGCANTDSRVAETSTAVPVTQMIRLTLPDKREIDCIYVPGSHQSGLSCDWANAK